MKKSHFLLIVAAFSFFLLIRCDNTSKSQETDKDDCFAGLSFDEKALIKKIIASMKSDKKDSSGIFGDNSVSYFYFDYFNTIRAVAIRPIDTAYARKLVNNYDSKRQAIEILRPDRIRRGGAAMKATDASSVWSSIDELGPFVGKLLDFQIRNQTKTGMKIVFGSYEWDAKDSDMMGGVRKYGDSLSGRNTVFLVGTYDTVLNQSNYFVTRHKEIKDLSSLIPVKAYRAGSVMNHGTLCPDSCTTP